ncbi:MAG: RNA polymerase factor sigma-54, partial [Oleispira sp.]|nr:RNA polymerase factor sigma-54 [Oleispira sp.]
SEIQEALESNPMLEVEEVDNQLTTSPNEHTDQHDSIASADLDGNPSSDTNFESARQDNSAETSLEEHLNSETSPNAAADELPVDSQCEESYQTSAGGSSSAGPVDDDFDHDGRNSTTDNLQDHILWQLNLTPMSPTDTEIAMALIDGLSDDGYLSISLGDVLESLDEALEVEEDEVLAVLHRMQQFEPAGVFAQDLQNCLLLQLNQLPENTPWLAEAKIVIEHHIALLGSKDYPQVMRKTKLSEDNLKDVLRLIQELTPRPGELIISEQPEYVIPDVIVRKVKDDWRVDLNPEIAPKLRVNADYASLVKRADNSPDNAYLKDNLQEARWFIKSLLSRNDTLLKVAKKIVEYQEDFFEIGDEGMKPLVLHDIAEAVEMHESTISRVTTQKFMHTPRGIFELKYFFSSHVSTDNGGECSSTAIRAMIKKLVAEESLKKPLSDNKIAIILGDKGIQVARRTVAKYREAMMIPPSNERKRLL